MRTILESLEIIVAQLNELGVRYLIAGGLAVNAHGYSRATHDIDLVLQLSSSNTGKALQAFSDLGFTPLVPVPLMQFADDQQRAQWIKDKGLTVFSIVSPEHPMATVDLFVEEPFDFEQAYERAMLADIAPGLAARFVDAQTLIQMKQQAGRPRDLDDIEHLRILARKS